MAGAVSELFGRVLRDDFPELDLARARVELIEMADAPLQPFHPALQRHAIAQLRRRGVALRLGTSVASVDAAGVTLADGQRLLSGTCVWAAGVQAEPIGRLLGLETGRAGRIIVQPDLTVPGHPDVFAIGDVAAATDADGQPLPQLAPVAMQQGRYVARLLADREAGRPTPPFRYVDKGTMATIGRRAAVAEVPGGLRFTGSIAWLAWLVLHIYFLIGFRNRLSVLLNWAWNYLTWDRAARVVPAPVASLDDAEDEPSKAQPA
jgi:NADH dehydrogenase